MKVKKVDIKITNINVSDNLPYLMVAKFPEDYPTEILNDLSRPPMETINVETITYPILTMYHPKKGYYKMAVQDKELFDELMEFQKGRLAHIKDESRRIGYDSGHKEGYNTGYIEAAKKIKKLSWWKRLFNKF